MGTLGDDAVPDLPGGRVGGGVTPMLKSLGQWIVVMAALAVLIGGGAFIGERVGLGSGPVVGLVLLVAVAAAATVRHR